jgi:mannose-1-phosphate guanylyltransferase
MLDDTRHRLLNVLGDGALNYVLGGNLAPLLAELSVPPAPPNILVEPAARNTLGAVLLATAHALLRGPDQIAVMLPADHYIPDQEAFAGDFLRALDAADGGAIVTLGIKPTGPDTAYGYIEASTRAAGPHAVEVKRFVEKPDLKRAEEYLAKGNFYWNSGMYFFKVSHMLEELQQVNPPYADTVHELARCLRAGDSDALARCFLALPSISIDYAVIEKAKRILLIPAGFAWSDVGAWDAVAALNGGSQKGQEALVDCNGSKVISADGGPFVAMLGVNDTLVISTKDAVLVLDKSRAQDVRRVVDLLRELGREDLL